MKTYIKKIKSDGKLKCTRGLLICMFKGRCRYKPKSLHMKCNDDTGYIFVPATKQEIAEYYEKKEAKK